MVISMLTLGSAFLLMFIINEWKIARLPMFPCQCSLLVSLSLK
jgi:hypothetical protein